MTASLFGLDNLPYGSFSAKGGAAVGVATGDRILNLSYVAKAGLLDDACENASAVFARGTLDAFLAEDAATWHAVRARVRELLSNAEVPEAAFVERASARMLMPFTVNDYVDFYASLEHATNVGRIFRPDAEPLTPNWRHLPIGYHGRSGTIVVSETPIARPRGQFLEPGATEPTFAPTRMLDFEIEVGFVMGRGNERGEPLAIDDVGKSIFGVVLLNDWSARDIQAWEYVPLGPFLGKSFATTISPWVVPMDALHHARVAPPRQDPPPHAYLIAREDWGFDIAITAAIETAAMRKRGDAPLVLSRTNMRSMYWTIAQMVAHMTSNGASVRPGDLYATGTISGSDATSLGSLLELTQRGRRPVSVLGESRGFLEDGDTLTITAAARGKTNYDIGFGAATGLILMASGLYRTPGGT